jgi:hypothetical protein
MADSLNDTDDGRSELRGMTRKILELANHLDESFRSKVEASVSVKQ